MALSMDKQIIKIGDEVGFKSDTEEYGTVKAIRGDRITVSVYDANTGQSENQETTADRVWHE